MIRRSPKTAGVVKSVSKPQQAAAPKRLQLEYVDITDIVPYEYNPRDNAKAIPQVAKSIQNFGFLVPCVIDAHNVLVAGHTRVEAAKLLKMTEVPCIRAEHLDEGQINAFRLIDNKVSEAAAWDHELLALEVSKLGDMGINWTDFGWSQAEIDCLTDVVASDCLEAAQVAQAAQESTSGNQARRSPATARFVLGEVTFFLPITAYRAWVDGLRQLHNFSEDAIILDLKQRLGILE
jgi:hypothetical protein